MAVDRTDEMIEIGDPNDEMPAPGPPPRVVIQYRDRGIPWMLVPPLLILSAAFAVVGVRAYQKRAHELAATRPPDPPAPVRAADPIPAPALVPAPAADLAVPPAPAPVLAVEAPTEPAPALEAPAAPPARPIAKVEGIGFDPDALKADARPDAPGDPAIAPAAGDPRRAGPVAEAGPPPGPDPRDQPAEVDPNLLPPDPKLGRQLRLQRIAESRRQAEADRSEYHSALATICKRYREKSTPLIKALGQHYGSDVDPAIVEKAGKVLASSGAGVARPVRINLLRSFGFPEPLILGDIFDGEMRHLGEGNKMSKAIRGGPRSEDEVLYRSAMILLGHPPTKAATASPARPASATRPRAAASPAPSGPSMAPDPPR